MTARLFLGTDGFEAVPRYYVVGHNCAVYFMRSSDPGKRRNRKSEVLGLDLSGLATNEDLAF